MVLGANVKNTMDNKKRNRSNRRSETNKVVQLKTKNMPSRCLLVEALQTKPLFTTIRKRETPFIGNIMRREGLEHLITMETLGRRQGRGRRRE